MNKHTPGPWRVVEDRVPSSLEVYAGKTAIAECWRRADVETEIANARLIAAAPELLAALKACLEKGSRWHPCDPIVQAARAAIANATGGRN